MSKADAQMPKTRKRLIDAAIKQLTSLGEQGLRVTAVAEAAGVTEPAVHYFFGNREGLVAASLAEQFHLLLAQLFVPFRDAALACTSKDEFRKVCIAATRAAFDPKRAFARSQRIAILGSATTRPQLASEIVASHKESLIPLIEGLSFAQENKWIPASLDLTAFAFWNTGQVTGRLLAEFDGAEVDLEQWSTISISAALHALGLN